MASRLRRPISGRAPGGGPGPPSIRERSDHRGQDVHGQERLDSRQPGAQSPTGTGERAPGRREPPPCETGGPRGSNHSRGTIPGTASAAAGLRHRQIGPGGPEQRGEVRDHPRQRELSAPRAPEISHDRASAAIISPARSTAGKSRRVLRAAGKCQKGGKKEHYSWSARSWHVPVPALAGPASGPVRRGGRIRTGVRPVSCGTLLLYRAPEPWDQAFDLMARH